MTRRAGSPTPEDLYDSVVREFGPALDRIAAAYEADPDKRRDLRQDIHLELWRSLSVFDGRCSLKTWVFRVAHNTAVTHVSKEQRKRATFIGLDGMEPAPQHDLSAEIDERKALERLFEMIRNLKPADRQVMLSYLEGMDAAAISEITGFSPANVSMKVSRIKQLLARNFREQQHA